MILSDKCAGFNIPIDTLLTDKLVTPLSQLVPNLNTVSYNPIVACTTVSA